MMPLTLSTPSERAGDALNYIGSIVSLLYFLSPLVQIIMLYKRKLEPQSIPLFLLLSILLNCLFWVIYATEDKDNILVLPLVTNSIGLGVNIVLMFLYLYIFLEQKLWEFLGYSFFVVDILVEIYYLMMRYIVHNNIKRHPQLIEFIANIIGVFMYASPAQNIFKVIKTGKYEMLPILTNVLGFVSTLIWLFYGATTEKPQTLASNGISFLIICAQIVFWGYYFAHAARRIKENNGIDIEELKNSDVKESDIE